MKLFGKKKEKEQPQQQPPFMPRSAQLPPLPPGRTAPKGTLAQDLGLEKDLANLPPLPEISPRETAPLQGDLSKLPPLPSKPAKPDMGALPPLAKENRPAPKLAAPSATAMPKAPVFIRLDKYNEIISTVNQMESRINELQNAIKKIGDVKAKEQEMISNWTHLLEEAKRRVDNVNQKLPEVR